MKNVKCSFKFEEMPNVSNTSLGMVINVYVFYLIIL